ncbi:hypothetical protein Godav_019997, partial [Gossypium davidsonii]|nr:hypothetical protein [Gossypium davidsonii]
MENLSGPRRSLAVYFTSALSIIFVAVFVLRQRFDQRCQR